MGFIAGASVTLLVLIIFISLIAIRMSEAFKAFNNAEPEVAQNLSDSWNNFEEWVNNGSGK